MLDSFWLLPPVLWGTLLLVSLAASMAIIATWQLQSVYGHYMQKMAGIRRPGREVAALLLRHCGLASVPVEGDARIDQYDWQQRQVKLRTETEVSCSIASLAIAAHEVGHAQQFAERHWSATAARLLHYFSWGAVVLVFAFVLANYVGWNGSLSLPLVILAGAVILVRAPVMLVLEFDASRRARRIAESAGVLDSGDEEGFARVLRAAWLTHAATHGGHVLMFIIATGSLWLLDADLALFPELDAVSEVRSVDEMPFADALQISPAVSPAEIPFDAAGNSLWLLDFPLVVLALAGLLVWWAWAEPSTRQKASRTLATQLNNRASGLFQSGQLAEAILLYDQALQYDPALAAALYNRAHAFITLGRFDAAREDLVAFMQLPSSSTAVFLSQADFWILRGHLALQAEDYVAAIGDLTTALSRGGEKLVDVWRNRGLAQLYSGHFTEALSDTNRALDLDPRDAVALNNRGVIFRNLGDLAAAEADFLQSLAIDPALPNPQKHLAALREANGIAAEPLMATLA